MPRPEGGAARKLDVVSPPSERVEYIPPMKPRSRVEKPHEPKVIIAEKMKREHETDEKHASDIREQIHPSIEKLQRRSSIERDLARDLITQFRREIESGDTAPSDAELLIRELHDERDQLMSLQGDARLAPKGEKVSEIMRENYRMLEEIESVLQSRDLAEFRFGKGVGAHEAQKEQDGARGQAEAEDIVSAIRTKYGAHPEELMGDRGWKGTKFRASHSWANIKNSLARIARQPEKKSDYALYREARAREEAGILARNERVAHERNLKRPAKKPKLVEQPVAPPVEQIPAVQKEEPQPQPPKQEEIPAPPEKIMKEYRESTQKLQEKMLTIKKVESLVPNAHDLWKKVHEYVQGNPAVANMLAHEEQSILSEDDGRPETKFVFLVARYIDARNKVKKDEEKKYYAIVMDYAKKLGLDGEAVFKMNLAEPTLTKDIWKTPRARGRERINNYNRRWSG